MTKSEYRAYRPYRTYAARVVDETPEERTRRVNEAVEKILERFPPHK